LELGGTGKIDISSMLLYPRYYVNWPRSYDQTAYDAFWFQNEVRIWCVKRALEAPMKRVCTLYFSNLVHSILTVRR